MYIVYVIPFTKNPILEEATYFSATPIPTGTNVEVPFGKQYINALVIDCIALAETKQAIRSAPFQLRKIKRILGPSWIQYDWLTVIDLARQYFVTSRTRALATLVPAVCMTQTRQKASITLPKEILSNQEEAIFQAPLEDRISYYRTYIRESFAKGHSIYIVVPTWFDADELSKKIERGIEQYVLCFHSNLPKKKIAEQLKQVEQETHPLCIVGTGSFLAITRHDTGGIIVENESSDAYISMGKPQIDFRICAYWLSKIRGIRFILADTFVRPETYFYYVDNQVSAIQTPQFQIEKPPIEIIDTKTQQQSSPQKKSVSITENTITKIQDVLASDKQIFLFCLRNGFAQTTACNDCGTRLICESCHAPLILYEQSVFGGTKRYYRCQRCKQETPSTVTCRACGSWNLVALGIGIDRVVAELKEQFPQTPIYRFDKETITSHKKALQALTLFYEKKPSILIGTELALYYVRESIPYSLIVSFDTLFSIPSYSIYEKILRILVHLGHITKNQLLIQTRHPTDPLLESFTQSALHTFYTTELAERKRFTYPPFTTLIKITIETSAQKIDTYRTLFTEILAPFSPDYIEYNHGDVTRSIKASIRTTTWSYKTNNGVLTLDPVLHKALDTLPKEVTIRINPPNLL